MEGRKRRGSKLGREAYIKIDAYVQSVHCAAVCGGKFQHSQQNQSYVNEKSHPSGECNEDLLLSVKWYILTFSLTDIFVESHESADKNSSANQLQASNQTDLLAQFYAERFIVNQA